LVEHFFRHEYGKLVSTLSRRVGVQHLEAIEDAVQSALMAALETWTRSGLPDSPSAWLFRVAQNTLLSALTSGARRQKILARAAPDDVREELAEASDRAGAERDDLLRMLFVCCEPEVPTSSRLVFALRTLCGFSTKESADRLFQTEANVHKRLQRARDRLRVASLSPEHLTDDDYTARLPAVQKVLYLLFTEGYLSHHEQSALRRELCDEAVRLATQLAQHSVGQTPETYALVSLMHLQLARMSSRTDDHGALLLLEEQDRSLWDRSQIEAGLEYLERSARGGTFSQYHAEAGIAAEHCLAPSFFETRWERIVDCYQLLGRQAPSAIHRLNCAVAISHLRGAEAGLESLDGFEPPGWLESSYLWSAVLADLHRRAEHNDLATKWRETALEAAPSRAVRQLLARRLGS
jgi:RNA polymerase sigma-70 factor (ECF subfamily)